MATALRKKPIRISEFPGTVILWMYLVISNKAKTKNHQHLLKATLSQCYLGQTGLKLFEMCSVGMTKPFSLALLLCTFSCSFVGTWDTCSSVRKKI